MTRQITMWSPDTCGCQIPIEWDDAEPQETRNHTLLPAEHVCSEHQSHTAQSVGSVVHEENTRKNHSIKIITELYPQIEPKDVGWSFNKSRNLEVTVPGASESDKTAIRNQLFSKLGAAAGKITVK